MSRAELLKRCEELGLKGYKAMNKTTLTELIREAEEQKLTIEVDSVNDVTDEQLRMSATVIFSVGTVDNTTGIAGVFDMSRSNFDTSH